jgi:hypothetical protein
MIHWPDSKEGGLQQGLENRKISGNSIGVCMSVKECTCQNLRKRDFICPLKKCQLMAISGNYLIDI